MRSLTHRQHLATPPKRLWHARLLRLYRDRTEKRLADLTNKIENSKEEFGDAEVFDASCERAEYLAQIGSGVGQAPAGFVCACNSALCFLLQKDALAAYDEVDTAHTSSGQKVDIQMAKALICLFDENYPEAKACIDAANKCVCVVCSLTSRLQPRDCWCAE